MRILFPLPTQDFEPTESAVPWRVLTDAGHTVVFAPPDGRPATPDERVLTGRGFGPWRPFLRAGRHARGLCDEMRGCEAFCALLLYAAVDADDFDGLVLTGGHAPGMRSYLDSELVHAIVARHMRAGKPVGAICHGVLAAARARDPETGRSVLHGRKSTALTATEELAAYGLTGLWLGRYYRTYEKTVQREVVEALATPKDFAAGPFNILREGPTRPQRGFVLPDGNYVSARFYVDTYKFAQVFLQVLSEHGNAAPTR